MAKEECCICNKIDKCSVHSKDEASICFDCLKVIASNLNVSPLKFTARLWTLDELKQMYQNTSLPTDIITEQNSRRWTSMGIPVVEKFLDIEFNHTNKMISLPNSNIFGKPYHTYSYNDIMKFEYYENSKMVTEGGIGKALVGGILFGTNGAIIGSASSKNISTHIEKQEVHIYIRKPETNDVKIYKIDVAHIFKYSKEKAEKLMLMIQNAIDMVRPQTVQSSAVISSTDKSEDDIPNQIRKFKALLDDGIITSEEFEIKKKQLLDI
mgnify:CR=1 FL=1